MRGFGYDLRYAVRLLREQPGFTAVALLTLALGIGATTAIFSVVNAVVLRPLPFPRSDRLVLVYENNVQRGWMTFAVAPANYADWARDARSFESLVAMRGGSAALIVDNVAEQVPATIATAELFRVFGGAAVHGRAFVDGDDAPGAQPIAVIGDGLWQRRFGGDPSVIGRVVTINDRPTQIVGVMARGFGRGNPDTDLWLPLTIDRLRAERGGRTLNVIGRLADGAEVDGARAEMTAIAARLSRAFPAENGGWGVTLIRLEEAVVGSGVKRALYLLLAAVGFVLLIACVNVANLLSARGVARHRELAIRAALGASRLRVVRQLLTESFVLASAGGVLGLFLATWGAELLLALAPAGIPRIDEVSLDGRVLAAGIAATLAAAVIFGLAPALQSSALRPDEALKTTSRGSSHPGRRRLSHVFVVAEVALAVVLVVGAGLLLRSFLRLTNQPIGFDPDHSLVFSLSLPEARYPSADAVSAFHRSVLERLRSLPGVAAAGATHALPFSGMDSVRGFVRDGEPRDAVEPPTSEYRLVTAGYFAAMGIPLKRGRDFTDADVAGQPGAIIVNEAFARQYLSGDPLGQRIRQAGSADLPWLTVVGVAGDVRHFGFSADIRPEMFWPAAQATWGATLNRHRRGLTFVVRTHGDPVSILPAIRLQVAALDPNRPVVSPRPMTALISSSAGVARFSTALLGGFALVGLVLAAAGVYGVMSYTVAAGRREMGIRLALGARPSALLARVLRGGIALAVLGGALGLTAAWLLGDALQPQLFKTQPHDTLTFAATAAVLLVVAFLACYVPARRAGRVDPIEALRD
jgi:putative ABC transport system permease protein